MLVFHGGTPTWWLHTGFCGFFQNISSNIRSLGKRTDLKLREVYALSISLASQLYPLNGFQFFYCVTVQAKNLKQGTLDWGLYPGEGGKPDLFRDCSLFLPKGGPVFRVGVVNFLKASWDNYLIENQLE